MHAHAAHLGDEVAPAQEARELGELHPGAARDRHDRAAPRGSARRSPRRPRVEGCAAGVGQHAAAGREHRAVEVGVEHLDARRAPRAQPRSLTAGTLRHEPMIAESGVWRAPHTPVRARRSRFAPYALALANGINDRSPLC